jgi:uncharacterized protein
MRIPHHRPATFAALLIVAASLAVARGDQPPAGKANYDRPFEPPTRSALIPLPPGAVEPLGWLRDWCLTAKDGYTGHMDDVDIAFRQAWAADYKMTGEQLARWDLGAWPYEGGGYWFEGLAKLALILHDDALLRQAKARFEPAMSNINPNGVLFLWWIDRNKAEDVKAVEGLGAPNPEWPPWANGLLGRALAGYYAGSGEARALKALEVAYSGSRDWLRLGWGMSNIWPAFETYTWTGNKQIKEALSDVFAKGGRNEKDWTWNRYRRMPNDKPGAELCDHGVHFCECTAPWALGYLWTGKREFLDAPLHWHDLVARDYMQPHGLPVFDEFYGPPGAFRGSETCDVAAYMWSNTLLLSVSGQGRLADRVERAFFNAGPATVSRDFKTHVYMQSPNRMADKSLPADELYTYKTKHPTRCCTAALNRFLPNYVMNMWMATRDNGLAAVCYGPCKVNALVADHVPVEITCKTDYPFNEKIEITVNPKREATFPLLLRIPGWCKQPRLVESGHYIAAVPDANGFMRIERLWKPNDKIHFLLPMSPSIATSRDANAGGAPYASVSLGPLLFALPIADTKDANTPDPSAKWQFALDAKGGTVNPDLIVVSPDLTVERGPMPRKWDWPLESPLRLRARAMGIDWKPTLKEPLPSKPFDGGKSAEWIALIPYGCTKFRVSMFPVTNWTFEKPGPSEPPKDSDGWGPERDGLRTRLLPDQKQYFIGRSAEFRLEMMNVGKTPRLYDAQQVSVNDPIRIIDPDGKPVHYIGTGRQTIGTSKPIAPGEKVVLFKNLDFDDQYLFAKPGRYTLRFRGRLGWPRFEQKKSTSEIPPSAAITIEMRPGTLPAWSQLPARLIEILPKGWDIDFDHISGYQLNPPGWESGPGRSISLKTCPPPDSKREALFVDVWIAEKKLTWTGTEEFSEGKRNTTTKIKPEEAAAYLGKGADGHVYWTVPKEAETRWPDIRANVIKALKIEPAESKTGTKK